MKYIPRILFEIVYFSVIIVVGLYSGYYVSRLGIEYLHRKAGFMINAIVNPDNAGWYDTF